MKLIWRKGLYWYSRLFLMFDPFFYAKKEFHSHFGRDMDLLNPTNLVEKFYWIEKNEDLSLMTLCADKYYAQEYIKALGLDYILKPILGVYKSADEIDFDKLPDEFFIKCNHVSGNNKVIRKKENPDYKHIRDFYNEVLKLDYYTDLREYQYHNIRPLILCEKCLRDSRGNMPVDYKFYCFGGEPKYWMVSCGEFDHQVRNHKFDMNCKSVDHHFKRTPSLSEKDAIIPENIQEMFDIVRKLCKPFPHVRVDLYDVEGHVYFGELTFTTNGGVINVADPDYDKEIGSWINLDDYKVDMI